MASGSVMVDQAPVDEQAPVSLADLLGGKRLPGSRCASGMYDPDLWYSEDPEEILHAQAICDDCPAKALCIAEALDRGEIFGIYGGFTALDLRREDAERDEPLMKVIDPKSGRFDHEARFTLWKRGLTDAVIAEQTGSTENAIQKWRSRNELESNTRRGRPRKLVA